MGSRPTHYPPTEPPPRPPCHSSVLLSCLSPKGSSVPVEGSFMSAKRCVWSVRPRWEPGATSVRGFPLPPTGQWGPGRTLASIVGHCQAHTGRRAAMPHKCVQSWQLWRHKCIVASKLWPLRRTQPPVRASLKRPPPPPCPAPRTTCSPHCRHGHPGVTIALGGSSCS